MVRDGTNCRLRAGAPDAHSWQVSSTPPRSGEMIVKRASPWQSMFAGMIAGIIEAGVTYPFEWAKTVRQFAPRDSVS